MSRLRKSFFCFEILYTKRLTSALILPLVAIRVIAILFRFDSSKIHEISPSDAYSICTRRICMCNYRMIRPVVNGKPADTNFASIPFANTWIICQYDGAMASYASWTEFNEVSEVRVNNKHDNVWKVRSLSDGIVKKEKYAPADHSGSPASTVILCDDRVVTG